MKRSSGAGSSRTQIGGRSTAGRLVEHPAWLTAVRAGTGAADTVPARAGLHQAPGHVGPGLPARAWGRFLARSPCRSTPTTSRRRSSLRRDAADGDHPGQHVLRFGGRGSCASLTTTTLRRELGAGRPPRARHHHGRGAVRRSRACCRALLGTRDATLMAYGVPACGPSPTRDRLRPVARRRAGARTRWPAQHRRAHRRADRDPGGRLHGGARGYVLGNYAASTVCSWGPGLALRRHIGLRPTRAGRSSDASPARRLCRSDAMVFVPPRPIARGRGGRSTPRAHAVAVSSPRSSSSPCGAFRPRLPLVYSIVDEEEGPPHRA
jgi:hypothetical protein